MIAIEREREGEGKREKISMLTKLEKSKHIEAHTYLHVHTVRDMKDII